MCRKNSSIHRVWHSAWFQVSTWGVGTHPAEGRGWSALTKEVLEDEYFSRHPPHASRLPKVASTDHEPCGYTIYTIKNSKQARLRVKSKGKPGPLHTGPSSWGEAREQQGDSVG